MEILIILAIMLSIIAILTVYNFILLINSNNKAFHSPLVIIGILLFGYYLSHIFVFTSSTLADGVSNLKAIYTFILATAIPFNYFLRNYCRYTNKKIFYALLIGYAVLITYNYFAPFGLPYSKIENITPRASVWEESFIIVGVPSYWLDIVMAFLILQSIYIILCFRHQYSYGKVNDTIFLGTLVSFMILVNFFDTYLININEQFTYALLYLIISIRSSNQVLDSYRLRVQLFQAQEKYKRIIDNSAFGIFQITPEGKFTLLNSAGKQILGFGKTKESAEVNFFSFFTDLTQVEIFKQTIFNMSIVKNLETVFTDYQGEEKYVRIFAKLGFNDEHNSVIDGMFEDFGEKKKAENLLIRAKLETEKSSKLKSEFLAMMSHEIRTPLNILIGSAEVVAEDLRTEENSELDQFFRNMKDAAARIIRTIESILMIAELKTGAYESKKKLIDLNIALIPFIEKHVDLLAQKTGLEFSIIKPSGPLLCEADVHSLQQIFVQLLDNAFKYTNDGKIEIVVSKTEEHISLIVSDSGIGMTNEFMHTMFSPFSQEDQSYSRPYEGNGLGLALVKEYCELNSISLEISSTKNVGSTFSMKIREVNI